MRSTTANGLVLSVEREPSVRELWRWTVSGPELVATGLALSERRAWEAAREAAREEAA